MIYTYEDVIKKANDSGLSGQLSQSDWDAAKKSPDYGISLLQLMQDASGADSEEKKMLASHAVNALRQSFGTTAAGGSESAGKVTELMGKVDSYGSFGYSKDPQYQQLLQEALNPEKFSYDPEKDASWAALQQAYRREGSRATQDTMAKAAAATGGVPSSYAVTAAQQAGNYYAGQLADRLPEMEQNAYQKYLNEIAQKLNLVGVMQTDRQQEQSDWQNGLAQLQTQLGNWQKQAETEYGQRLDAANMAYQILQNAIAQEQQKQENEWTQRQLDDAAAQQKVSNAMAMMKTLGYATPEIAQALGIPEGTKVNDGKNDMASDSLTDKLVALGVSAADAAYTATTYPNGLVTNEETWNALLDYASEAELNAAGFRYEGAEKTLDYSSAVSLLGTRLGNNPKKVADAIEKGYLEAYEEGNQIKVRKGPKWDQWSPEEEQNKKAAGGPKLNII